MQSIRRISASLCGPLGCALSASLLWISLAPGASAQTFAQTSELPAAAAPLIPQQVRYAGKLATRAGDSVEAVFRIYATPEGGEPLWTETQKVTVAEDGSYTVLLGAATPAGLPQAVFAGGQARWLGVSVERAPELDRALLASVPYAMKSADAEALSGHTAADFVTQAQLAQLTAQPSQTAAQPAISPLDSGTVTGSGTNGTIPVWTGDLTQGNSIITEVGKDIGINVAAPTATLDVGGSETLSGTLLLSPIATATTAAGSQSSLMQMAASAWSTTANAPVTENFDWVVYPTGNNTATPGGVLSFRYNPGGGTATNLITLSSTGVISFVPAQTFPGTIKSVAATSPVTAATTSGAVTVGLNTAALETTLNTVYPRLAAANAFTGNQSITGGLTVTGSVAAASSAVTGLASAAAGFLSNGAVTIKPATAATTSAAVNSPLLELGGSAWSSTSSAAVAQNFAWQAQATGNNTATPTANLALLYGAGTAAPTATGLSIAPNGNINFSSTQVFPITGTGGGTITGITTTSPLTGSGTTGSVALALNETTLTNDITPALEGTFNGVYAQLGAANTFTSGQVIDGPTSISGSNLSGSMLTVTNSGDSFSTAISLSNGGQYGIGLSASASSNGDGIEGFGTQTAGSIGVLGALANSNGFSNSYFLLESDDGLDAGVWADGADGQEAALIATSDDLSAGVFFNDSPASSTILVLNNYSGGPTGNVASGIATAMRVGGPSGMCGVNQAGNLSCTGQVKTVVSTKNSARQVETYAVQSAENWIEDYGSGQLDHGSATITLEPAFAETVNTGVEFHVFLTPGGDCKGLYVTNKTAGSFEVHELGGGTASIPFDYKIVGKRNGMEGQRLVDVTERMSSEAEAARLKTLDRPLPRTQMPKIKPVVAEKLSSTNAATVKH